MITNRIHSNLLIFFAGSCWLLSACTDSTFGPTIVAKDTSGDNISEVDSGASGTTASTTLNCQNSPVRKVFYGLSSIRQLFVCNKDISSSSLVDNPEYITGNSSGSIITFSGTAPSATSSSTAWKFYINQTTTKLFEVTSKILDNTLLSSVLANNAIFDTSNAGTTNNSTEFNLGHRLTLDSSWDGNITDASLTATQVSSDIPSLVLTDTCSSGSGNYICNSPNSQSGLVIDNNLKINWKWSVYDQGSYYIDVTPQATIEGGVTDLPITTLNATIPIQTGGNTNFSGFSNPNGSSYNQFKYNYSIAISKLSTPTNPIVATTFVDTNSSNRYFLKRLVVNRSVTPSSGSTALDSSANLLEQNTANSRDFDIKSLLDGSWVVMGVIASATSDDVLFNRVTDSTTPSIATTLTMTSYSSTDRASSISMSEPFDDNGTTRIGAAFVRMNSASGTNYFVKVVKLNPFQSTANSVLDDPDFVINAGGATHSYEYSAGANSVDRTKIIVLNEPTGTFFYVAFREGTDLKILKLKSTYSNGHTSSGNVVASSIFNASPTSTNQQSLSIAGGIISNSSTLGLVYRDQNGDCYFVKSDAALNTYTPVKFTTSNCYHPSVHFNPETKRFLITYSELNASSFYDVKSTEFTVGTTDSFSTPNVISANLSNYPIKLTTSFFSAGHWMAVFYRLYGSSNLKFHGYHVPGR